MKLVNFQIGGDTAARLGLAIGGRILDVRGESALAGVESGTRELLPASTDDYLRGSEASRLALRRLADAAARRDSDSGAGGVYREQEVEFLLPVLRPGKVIAAGRNFHEHLTEAREKRGVATRTPSVPIGFIKVASALTAHRRPIVVPEWVENVDYESELVLVIGKAADGVSEEDALSYVAGYTVGNDVSARRIQFAERDSGGGSCAGKNVRSFGPMGPCLVTADEVANPLCLRVWSRVNGELRQDALTTDMIFDIRKLVAWYSQIGLDPGDMIMSGTPAGVAIGGKGFLMPGDTVQCGVDGIGVLENTVERA